VSRPTNPARLPCWISSCLDGPACATRPPPCRSRSRFRSRSWSRFRSRFQSGSQSGSGCRR
jgi:hypothetical protein